MRFVFLASLMVGAVACGVPLSPAELTATAVNGGNLAPTPANDVHVLASSLLAPIVLDQPGAPGAPASGTPPPGGTAAAATPPGGTPQPGASTPAANVTPPPGSPTAAAATATRGPGTSGASPAVMGTPGTPGPTSPTPPSTATPVALSGGQPLTSSSSAATAGDPASQALKVVNDARSQRGLAPLRSSGALTLDAASYAKYLGDQNYFAHDGLDGSSPSSRATRAGYAGRFKGEALAAGQSSAESALSTWLGSPAHAAIVLDGSAVDVGIGYYSKPGSSYTYYWVLVTGVP